MRRSVWERIREILKKHVIHGKWVRAVISLACVVIFITTYVLIMPAVTLSRAADCGQEEHTHTEDCYETESELTCGQEEHTHSGDCYDEEGNLICGMEEHVHDDGCYTSREVLVCGQEEHVHTEDCYAETETIQEDTPEEEYEEEQEEPAAADEEEQPQVGETVTEQVVTAAPEQLSQIRFKEYLTDWTTIYYAPEDGDNWQPLAEDKWHSLYGDNWGIRRNGTEDRGLDPEEEVLLHIGYRIPAGRINATNPEAEFILPLSINMTEEEVRENNKYYYSLFSGTDREADQLFVDGEYEIKEEWNSDGEVTLRKLVITFNEDACRRCGGEKLTDGTETLAAEELEGFFELRVKAEDLLTLEKESESAYVLEWNDEENLDTIVRFDPEKLAAYYDTENTDDAEAETEGPVSGELRAEGKDYTITVSYTEEASLPADVSLKVKEITRKKEYESYKAQMEEELIDPESTQVTGARFFDITLEDNEGNELHPESGVRVLIETKDTLQENEKVQICHFDEEKDKPVEVESREVTGGTYEEENLGVEFEAESFSVYGVVYTVDFEYSVNGKMYQFSLPGGGFVSFTDLVEMLGITGDTNSDKNGDENGAEIADNAKENDANEEIEENGLNSDTNTPLTLGDGEVSEATRKFVTNVASVEFSSPSLVDISKVENEITVGQIKEGRRLECQYSAELTEEQIAEINAQTVEAGDWALISVQPFTSEEEITVTMKDGEVFTIRVTDAQIKKTVIDAKGDTWEITVTYGEDAQIPDGAELKVREILENTEEYIRYLENSAKELGFKNDAVSFARFFDIEIIKDGIKVEPKSPVQVSIAYKDSMQMDSENQLKVVHFSDDGTEIITEIEVNDDATRITYMQDSFSVTGTIIDGTPNTGSSYMVIATYNGQDYIVNSDGSLSPVQYKSGSEIQFDVEYPMLWDYGSEGGNTYIRHRSVASYLNPGNQVAEEWAHKYLDPRKELATTMEETTHNHPSLASQAAISYNNGKVSGGGYYLGAAVVDGTLRMVGQKSEDEAVLIRFATPPESLFSGNNNHSVNHIDIAVEANAELHVPLAYGTYYDSEGNVLFTVDRNNNKTLEIEVPNVSITHEDIKRSTITAYTNYDSNGDGVKEKTEVPDAFYITGYSSNLANEQSHGNDQVRIEGVFKVADLDTYTGRNITTHEWWGDWTRWNDDPNNDPDIRTQRLLKRIYYTVTTPVTVRDVILKDENGNELYDAQGNLLKVNATATVMASFDYWDKENECPPIVDSNYWWYSFNWDNWQSGWIHPVDISGMDFRLGGDSDTNTEIQAVEISKFIVDDLGRTVEIASPVRSQFDIYYKPVNAAFEPSEDVIGHHIGGYDPSDTTNLNNGYTKVDSTHIDVQPGVDLNYVYDYDVDPGMFYITEDKSEENLPQTIVDKNGQVWTYSYTRIETESVWRNDAQNDYKMHISKDYTRDDNAYESVPEVLGYYTGSYNGVDANGNGSYGSTTYPDTDKETGQPVTKTFRNGFLEFYVYNVYTSGKRLDVEKVWDGGEPDNSEVKVELQYRKRMIKAAESEEEIPENERGEWSDYLPVKNDPLFSSNLITEITLKPDADPEKNWKGSFYNLPKVLTDGEGNIYEVDYTAEETSVLINGTDVTDLYVVTTVKTPATGEDAETNAGTVTITNKKGSLSFVKKWYNTDGVTEVAPPSASPAVITAEIRRNRVVATEVDDIPVVVTLMAKTDAAGSEYVALRSVEVKSGSDLWFSLATSGTSNPTYSADPEDAVPVKHSGYTVTYSNGITKNGNANMFSLSNITVNTTVYAVFPENTLKGKGFGYFIDEDSYEKPGTSTAFSSEDEKVSDITLNQSNGWSYTLEASSMEAGWHYYINTDPEKGAVITETGLPENSYTFNPGPIITKDDDGNIVYACTNTSNGVDVTLKKVDISNLNNDGAALLKGATFTITRYTDKNFNIIGEPSWSQTKADTKAGNTYTLNGVFQFTDLPIGFYKIEEPVMPDGYVKTGDDPVFEITSDMSILLYTKNAQGQYVPVNEGYTDIIRISNSKNMYVGNTPGAALPNTGGPGTRIFTILGSILTFGAGLVWMRKRRRAEFRTE